MQSPDVVCRDPALVCSNTYTALVCRAPALVCRVQLLCVATHAQFLCGWGAICIDPITNMFNLENKIKKYKYPTLPVTRLQIAEEQIYSNITRGDLTNQVRGTRIKNGGH